MKIFVTTLILAVFSALAMAKTDSFDAGALKGYMPGPLQVTNDQIRAVSPVGMDETVDRLSEVIQNKGMRVFVNDEAARQGRIEMQVLPGELLIYGSYRRAKSITRCSMDVLDELPDMLVVESEGDGATIITGNPESLGNRDDGNCKEVLAMLSDAMQEIVSTTVKG